MALQLFKIASTTVETPQATISFSNIPQGYTDLILVVSARSSTDTVSTYGLLRFNSDSGANYNRRTLLSNGSAASSSTSTSATSLIVWDNASDATASTFANAQVYIPNYTSSNQKSVSNDSVSENNATAAYAVLYAGLWTGTAAITSISITEALATFTANSTFTLYGVL